MHQGFLKSWVANGLNQTIVKRMQGAVEGMQDDGGKVKLYVTGEALGMYWDSSDPKLGAGLCP